MHHLNRETAPDCLTKATANNTWRTLDPECKAATRLALRSMQKSGQVVLCAYCERDISKNRSHVEHLASQHRFPQKTLEWSNLFLSCESSHHCGRYKDHKVKQYNPDDIIHPDEEDPDDFLQFFTDGSVAPKAGLGERDRFRAQTTIDVLGLAAPTLVERRREAVRQAAEEAECIPDLLAEISPNEAWAFISQEIAAARGQPHETVFRHLYRVYAP